MVEVDERDREDDFTPSSGCFRDFCRDCVNRYNLHEHVSRHETVRDIDFDIYPQGDHDVKVFRVLGDHGQYFSRTVVLAIGGGTPIIPAPFPSRLPKTASHAMWLDEDCVMDQRLQSKIDVGRDTSALVVGGGLTSAQIANCLISKGVRQIHLIMKGPWKGEKFSL